MSSLHAHFPLAENLAKLGVTEKALQSLEQLSDFAVTPRTQEACLRTGVDARELQPLTADDFNLSKAEAAALLTGDSRYHANTLILAMGVTGPVDGGIAPMAHRTRMLICAHLHTWCICLASASAHSGSHPSCCMHYYAVSSLLICSRRLGCLSDYALSSLDTEEPLRPHTEALRLPKSRRDTTESCRALAGTSLCMLQYSLFMNNPPAVCCLPPAAKTARGQGYYVARRVRRQLACLLQP